jgi:2-methylisocitrate lyase-like PEP mutase family enzyme
LNVLAGPGTPPVVELERIGVARVTTGSAFMRACFAKARDVARDILGAGSWQSLLDRSISYAEMNELTAERNVRSS